MTRCLRCDYALPLEGPRPQFCPHCGGDWTDEAAPADWVPIARITNLAEVGYFADRLDAMNVETDIVQHDEFSAVDGSWSSRFILRVRPEHTAAATELLRREMGGARRQWAGENDPDPAAKPLASAASWTPLVLVLMAGGLAYCAGRNSALPWTAHVDAASSLSAALCESTAPLTSSPAPGQPGRRLRFDPASHSVLLEEDFDGDGSYERRRQFSVAN